MEIMSPEKFARRMLEIKSEFYDTHNDIENCHILMNSLMMHLLRCLGYGDGIDIFTGTSKGYE